MMSTRQIVIPLVQILCKYIYWMSLKPTAVLDEYVIPHASVFVEMVVG